MNRDELVPELQEYDRQFKAIDRDAARLVDGLSEPGLAWREQADSWSIADCLNHLAVTGNHSLVHIRLAIVDARSRGVFGRGRFRHPVLGNLFIPLMDAPPRLRFKAPRVYRPVPDMAISEILAAFRLLHEDLARALRDANGIHLGRVKVANPMSTMFRLSLGQEFAMTAAHERRHLWQAWRIRGKLPRDISGPGDGQNAE